MLSYNPQEKAINSASDCSDTNRLTWHSWIILVFIILVSGLIRYRLIDVPLERDEGEYAYVGQLILQGSLLYKDVYIMKMPGVYAVYALLLAVFGQSHQGIHVGLLILNAVTIVLVFLLAKQLLNSLAAVISASVFAVLSVSQSVHGIFANAEHFVIFFSVAGLLVFLKAAKSKSYLKLFGAGVLLCLGFITKQYGVMFCILAVVYIAVDGLLQRKISWKPLIGKLLALSAGMASVLICLLLILVWSGVFKQFWFWTMEYAAAYVSQVPLSDAGDILIRNFSGIFASAPLLWTISGLGMIVIPAAKQIHRPDKLFLLLFAIFSFIAVCPSFFFRPHYFILVLPSAALLCGAAVWILSQWISVLFANRLSVRPVMLLILSAVIGQSILHQSNYLFQMSTFQVCRSTYWLNPFPESLPIASFIRDHTTPEDTIAIFGSEPQICFYARRRSASGYIYMYPLTEQHPFALQMQKEFVRQTEAQKPAYVVLVNLPNSWFLNNMPNMLIFDWINPYLENNYNIVGTIELFDDRSEYHWYPEVKWPVSSQYSIVVFERIPEPGNQ